MRSAGLAVVLAGLAAALSPSPTAHHGPRLRASLAFANPLEKLMTDVGKSMEETRAKLEATRINLMDRFGLSPAGEDSAKKAPRAQSQAKPSAADTDAKPSRRALEIIEKHQLTPGELAKIKKAFKAFDRDGSGVIDEIELNQAMNALGHKQSKEETQRILRQVDKDGSTGIEMDEFLAIMAPKLAKSRCGGVAVAAGNLGVEEKNRRINETVQRYGLSEAQLAKIARAWSVFDKDGGGSISVDELARAMSSLGHAQAPDTLRQMVAEVDVDGSGEVEYDEFVAMMAPKLAARR